METTNKKDIYGDTTDLYPPTSINPTGEMRAAGECATEAAWRDEQCKLDPKWSAFVWQAKFPNGTVFLHTIHARSGDIDEAALITECRGLLFGGGQFLAEIDEIVLREMREKAVDEGDDERVLQLQSEQRHPSEVTKLVERYGDMADQIVVDMVCKVTGNTAWSADFACYLRYCEIIGKLIAQGKPIACCEHFRAVWREKYDGDNVLPQKGGKEAEIRELWAKNPVPPAGTNEDGSDRDYVSVLTDTMYDQEFFTKRNSNSEKTGSPFDWESAEEYQTRVLGVKDWIKKSCPKHYAKLMEKRRQNRELAAEAAKNPQSVSTVESKAKPQGDGFRKSNYPECEKLFKYLCVLKNKLKKDWSYFDQKGATLTGGNTTDCRDLMLPELGDLVSQVKQENGIPDQQFAPKGERKDNF